jgi:hypothetical protein
VTDEQRRDDDTFEQRFGPVRSVYSRGGERVVDVRDDRGRPLAWHVTQAELLSQDVDGRPVQSVTVFAGRGVLAVKFEDGEEVEYPMRVRGTHCDEDSPAAES